jgi:hypothetical protein
MAALAGTASAADSIVTFAVTGGSLSITAPAGPVSIGSVASSLTETPTSAALGAVTVTDLRGGELGWTVTAGATSFVNGSAQTVTVATAGKSLYTAPDADPTATGTVTVTPTSLTQLSPPASVQVATAVDGANSATWSPTIGVTVPASANTGTYTSTLTHSVA